MTPFLVDAAPVSGRSSGEKSATRGCVLSGGSDETDGGATPSSWPVSVIVYDRPAYLSSSSARVRASAAFRARIFLRTASRSLMPSSKPLSGKTCVLTPAVAGRCSMLRPCCPLASNVPSGTPGLLARDKVGALAETNIVAQRSRCMLRLASDFPNSLRRVTLSCRISATGCFERVPTALRDQWSGGEGTGSSSGSHELDPSSRVVSSHPTKYMSSTLAICSNACSTS
mmetsp:Transcript_22584/g.47523  ORF Transcript_22584/g.47523 Transcript_22584/m.47523 type:complete len:228 (+) Transcript_22584:679-1362(+)